MLVSSPSPAPEQTETGGRSSQGGAAGYYRGEGEGKHGHGPHEDRGVDVGERQSHDPTNQGGEGGVGEEPEKVGEDVQLVQSQQEVKLTQETFNVPSLKVLTQSFRAQVLTSSWFHQGNGRQ